MALQCIRFRHNERLQLAAENAPAMHRGEKGHPVRLLQQGLIDSGFPLPKSVAKHGSPDGDYGQETKQAVWKFQHREKLDKDGAAGRQTLTRLDTLLKGKPAPPLPDIPGPGGAKDVAVNAELVICDVTASSTLSFINFHLEYGERARPPDPSDSTPNPILKTHRASVRGANYMKVAEAVYHGNILVQGGAAAHTAAQYVPAASPPTYPIDNTMLIGREISIRNANDRSLIVHEATHAVCDVQKIGSTDAIFSEMIAYMGEAYYRQLTGLGPKRGLVGDAAVVYQSADFCVNSYRRGDTPPQHLLDNVWFSLVNSHPHMVGAVVQYNGV